MPRHPAARSTSLTVAAITLVGCAGPVLESNAPTAVAASPTAKLRRVRHLVVIYAEKLSFDNLLIGPHVKRGHIDHTTYDTTSVLKFITERRALEPLPGVRANVGNLGAALD